MASSPSPAATSTAAEAAANASQKRQGATAEAASVLEAAAKAREEGNAQLKKGDFAEAVAAYTRGVAACEAWCNAAGAGDQTNDVVETLAVLLSNRSAAHLRRAAHQEALADADACLQRKPCWGKAFGRRGAALWNLGRVEEGLAAYEEGARVDTENAHLRQGIAQCKAHLASSAGAMAADASADASAQGSAKEDTADTGPGAGDNVGTSKDHAASEEVEDPLASFMDDIEALESNLAEAKQKAKAKPEDAAKVQSVVDHAKETAGWTAVNQLDRILCKNHEWINTNPFEVLGIKDEKATAFDVKKRYHKLSTLVHPDKTSDARAEDAFAEVKRAYERLKDDASRERTSTIIEQCKASVRAEREKMLDEGYALADVDAKLGTLEAAYDRKIKLEFATRERERRQNEIMKRKYNERELEKEKSEQEYWQSVKKVEENMRETREVRAKAWQGFSTKRLKRKK